MFNPGLVSVSFRRLRPLEMVRFPGHERRPLTDGENEWKQNMNILAANGGGRELLLEFVRDDFLDQLREDASTLRSWIQELAPNAA
jgi:hypothetical protein